MSDSVRPVEETQTGRSLYLASPSIKRSDIHFLLYVITYMKYLLSLH